MIIAMTDIKTVALLVGGWSPERDVSLNKGKAVKIALETAGYDVHVVDVKRDLNDFIDQLTPRPDVAFNNIYGKGGEDGIIQGVLEMMQIPYTHSSVMASAVGMDKEITKIIAQSVGINVPETLTYPYSPPYVLKPVDEGSSVDITIVFEQDNFQPDLTKKGMIAERYIAGREIHVTVLDGRAIDVTEIHFSEKFFDYDAKYNSKTTTLTTPADIPDAVRETAMKYAEDLYKAIHCGGLARCDMRYDPSKKNGENVFLMEINTMPGMAPGSVAVEQPLNEGMSFPDLCAHLVETATVKNK